MIFKDKEYSDWQRKFALWPRTFMIKDQGFAFVTVWLDYFRWKNVEYGRHEILLSDGTEAVSYYDH
jgi:uncharacterized membrane protein YobD (UPF0266 family)